MKPVLEIVLITGMSGSGKSVALHALEDTGYYCVDNLPPELLTSFAELEKQHAASKVAIAMDVRSATDLPEPDMPVIKTISSAGFGAVVIGPAFLLHAQAWCLTIVHHPTCGQFQRRAIHR